MRRASTRGDETAHTPNTSTDGRSGPNHTLRAVSGSPPIDGRVSAPTPLPLTAVGYGTGEAHNKPGDGGKQRGRCRQRSLEAGNPLGDRSNLSVPLHGPRRQSAVRL